MSSADVRQKVFRVPSNIVISVGLSWDFIGATPVDLDLSAVCFTREGQFIDVVFFNHLFPEGTEEEALRSEFLVDPAMLPYMFLSGDSTIGGEQENRMSGGRRAERRRRRQEMDARRDHVGGATVPDNIFNRLYDQEELPAVQQAVDEAQLYGGDVHDEHGELVRRVAHRELCDEVVTFVMHKLPREAEVVLLCVTSYTGADFTALSKARLVLYNESTNERVGSIDLKSTTGRGTANLACMLMRVPAASPTAAGADGAGDAPGMGHDSDCWDLRELNVCTSGYTFVDVLPLMLDVAGVARNSRMEALQGLPNYSLRKPTGAHRLAHEPLSDVRFGVGWDGEHDVDAFLVMLDEHNNYVDHVYPKQGRLRSHVRADLAQHSGDALSGTGTAGDEEFIDLMAYRVPPQVRTIAVGATYMESYGANQDNHHSVFDIPGLYMRLQNRALDNPYSMELDRWSVSGRRGKDAPQKQGSSSTDKKQAPKNTYRAADGSRQPVRTLLLGVMLKKGEAPLDAFHLVDVEQQYAAAAGDGAEQAWETAPVFEFVPVHQHMPVDPRNGFSRVIPVIQCIATYIWGSSSGNGGGGGGATRTARRQEALNDSAAAAGATRLHTLNRENNLVGWDTERAAAVGGYGALGDEWNQWEDADSLGRMTDSYAIELRFLEVTALEPRLPDKFKCHCEAWVCGHGGAQPAGVEASPFTAKPFKSPFLVSRANLRWDESSSSAAATFLVHRYDRIRVMLYEFAAFGYADIDLMKFAALFSDGRDRQSSRHAKSPAESVDLTVALQGGGHLSKGEVRVRLSRVSMRVAKAKLQKEADRENNRRERHAQSQKTHQESRSSAGFNPCAVM